MSYNKLLYHIVWRPLHSKPVISVEYERDLYAYVVSIVKGKGGVCIRIGGMPDHVHMLLQLPPTISISDFMRDVKTSTSAFMKKNATKFPYFEGWGKTYFVSSCSEECKEAVRTYIINQKEHHKKVGYAEEMRQILHECGIELDERYAFLD